MKERPILFSAPMVRAIVAGTKTQTRRIVKPGVLEDGWPIAYAAERCPYGAPGDRLWVRETWAKAGEVGDDIEYRADNPDPLGARWRPSIHMPRWASRLLLEVTAVRVERLQDISEDDACAEGVQELDGTLDELALYARAKKMGECATDSRVWFAELWDSINGTRAPWASNPFVWVVSFKRTENT